MQLRGADVEQVIDVIKYEKRKNLQKDEKRYLTKGNGSGNIDKLSEMLLQLQSFLKKL